VKAKTLLRWRPPRLSLPRHWSPSWVRVRVHLRCQAWPSPPDLCPNRRIEYVPLRREAAARPSTARIRLWCAPLPSGYRVIVSRAWDGSDAGEQAGQSVHESTLGQLFNATAIGSGAIVDASNKVRLRNTSVTRIEGQVGFTASSGVNQKEKPGARA